MLSARARGIGAVARRPGAGGAMPLAGPAGRLRCALDAGRTECECEIRGAVDTGVGKNIGPDGDFFLRRGKFLLGKSPFTEANFREIFQNLWEPPRPPRRAPLLVRLRRGQAICRLAHELARFLIRNGAGRGERGRVSGRSAELALGVS